MLLNEMCVNVFLLLSFCSCCCFASLVPDDQSLKVYRAEANFGMMRFSDALSDLDYLCRLRPNWTEVRETGIALIAFAKHLCLAFIVFFFFCTAQTNLLKSSINDTRFRAAISPQFTSSLQASVEF